MRQRLPNYLQSRTLARASARARAHTHTHTHTHTHICSIDLAIGGSTDEKLLLESSGVRPSHSILCHPWLRNLPLEVHFQSREQPKVRRVRWLGDDRNVLLGEELLHYKCCVARYVIVMQEPLSLPLVAPIPETASYICKTLT
jgi:hypothetical protein